MKSPPPWLDDATVPARLVTDLSRVTRASRPYDQAHGLSSLQATLKSLDAAGAGSAAAGGAAAGASGAAGIAIKAVFVALVGGVAWTGWTAWTESQPRTSQPRAAEAVPEPARESPVVAAPAIPEQPPAAEDVPNAVRARVTTRPAPEREVEQLQQVRALLAEHPSAAYRLARRSAREFPRGVLREEREGLSVLSLWRMGKRGEARAAGAEFVARYPQSPLRSHIEELIAPP